MVEPVAPGNLPLQLTSFVGRETAIAEVKRLLDTTRLLTLTGAGGCGKSRLALRVGEEARRAYADGAWLVELAALSDPTLIPQTVVSALGLREAAGRPPLDLLTNYLRGRSLLLILDNCEHLAAACAELAETLLRACPGPTILATSRHVLGVPGETAWRVPSLAVPDLQSPPTLEHLTHYEAVRLFVDRATAAQPGLRVTPQNAPAIARICHQLDGMPLAIELAAARARVFAVEQIAARLDDRFRLLTTGPRTALPRQQSLRATIDWSYDLLSEPERALLCRLSVFAGGWTLEAAEVVAMGDGVQPYAVLDLLAGLVDKSLVIAEERRGAVRYRLLETIRQYARDRLQAAGEAAGARDRQLAYFLALAEEAEPRLRGAESQTFLERLEEEHANLRAALEWAMASPEGGEAALRLSGALAWFWWLRSYHDEGLRWLERALTGAPEASAARMKALHGAGYLAHHRRDSALARALFGESLAIARSLDDRWTVAWVLHSLGRVAYYDDDPAAARALGEESLAVAEAVGDRWLIAWPLHLLGLAAHIAADYPTARDFYSRSLAIRRELGYREGIGILLHLLGVVAVREGDLGRARTLFREGLAAAQAVHGPWGLAMPLAGFAYLAAALGQPRRAMRLGAAAAAISESSHSPLVPLFDALLREGLEAARAALDDEAYAAAWAEGRAMPLEESIAEAFAVEAGPPAMLPVSPRMPPTAAAHPRKDGPFGELTPAELQVLRLLSRGRTTKEIAAELVVAVSTVDRHLTHIYGKLGVRNRAEATAFSLQHGLV